jgi:hypothetical protein
MSIVLYAVVIVGLLAGTVIISARTQRPIYPASGHTVMTSSGLHMALPDRVQKIPVELVPEP